MKLKPVRKHLREQLHESVTREDFRLWWKYCVDTHSEDNILYMTEELDDIIDHEGWDSSFSFWVGVDSVNVRGSKGFTYANMHLRGWSEEEIRDRFLSDPDFLEWKRTHAENK